jgi:NADH-ubiquinone oxidoreductase chain 3
MNAWSPAQRYFVEGDHVINAELNRTFQFTGLDAGSFYPFLVYTTIATAIASVFMIIPWLIAPQRVDLDKTSAYECGFDAFGEARQTFSVSFYLVSIMYAAAVLLVVLC